MVDNSCSIVRYSSDHTNATSTLSIHDLLEASPLMVAAPPVAVVAGCEVRAGQLRQRVRARARAGLRLRRW